MTSQRVSILSAAACLAVSLHACDDAATTAIDAPAFARADAPALPAATDFVAAVTNPFFPLVPGTVHTYRAATDEGVETTIVAVTNLAKNILGIAATVVNDRVFLDGALIEDTFDWYAQDRWGNVWYLGEDSCEIEDGQCVSTAGSWEAGVDDARAGIIVWADPAARTGRNYRQEFYAGEAEDMAKVLHTNLAVTVPAGRFTGCVETMDWTPLEPGARERKFYCPRVGVVLELHPRGGRGRNELISVSGP